MKVKVETFQLVRSFYTCYRLKVRIEIKKPLYGKFFENENFFL